MPMRSLFCVVMSVQWGDEDNVPYWAKLPSVNPNVIRKESSAPEEAESAVEIEQVKPKPQPKPKQKIAG